MFANERIFYFNLHNKKKIENKKKHFANNIQKL